MFLISTYRFLQERVVVNLEYKWYVWLYLAQPSLYCCCVQLSLLLFPKQELNYTK